MSKILSSEIISLVHHVKLNESGWWEKAMQNIIVSTFGINGNAPMTENEILESIHNDINTNIDRIRVIKQIELLRSKKIILPIQNDLFQLSEDAFSNFKSSFASQKEIEFEAEKRFNNLCAQLCPGIQPEILWKELNDTLIIPLIREIGAKTYELVSGKESLSIDQYSQFTNFVSRYDQSKINIQGLLLNYFDFKNEYVKKYVLHQLNAYFFIEASNLNQETVEQIYSLSKSQTNLKVFVDTNFLLTLLDLHDNPSNDASFSLLELLDEIRNRVTVKFYILPITILEFQNLIGKFKEYLKRLKPSLNQAVAAEISEDISGIIKKYFQKCHERKEMLNIDDYFDPYLDNFTVNIRKRGLEIEQVNMDRYATDQRVVDDLLEQVDYRYDRNDKQGKYEGLNETQKEEQKNQIYSRFNHDCKLWYYVKDKRPAYIDSTKDIKNWILTLDFNFLEFDKYKQLKEKNNSISLCLHPNEFIAMLQFWVPRTEKFENAILGNFRLPFLFKEVNLESEKVSLEILRAIAQYEDSEKFSSELVTEILTNKALRQKIKPQNTVEENAQLIKEEIFKKYEAAKQELNKEKEKKESLSEELILVRSELSSLNKKFDALQEQTNKKIEKELELIRNNRIQELQSHKDALLIKKEQLENRIKDYEEQIVKANKEFDIATRSLKNKIKSVLIGKNKYKLVLKEKIHNNYYNTSKYNKLLEDLSEVEKDYNNIIIPAVEEKIIIYCENKNSVFLNKLNFKNIHFIPESNSNAVFIKIVSNPTHFGLRDRDFLSDKEIEKLKKEYNNYFILEYYCFENYLYHPDNIAELLSVGFDKNWYINELIRQKGERYDKIVMNLKNDRNGYQEFKTPDNKFREKNDEIICEYLKSSEVEIFLKSFSLKSPNFDKSCIAKFQLTADKLTSTEWFRKKIEQILTF
jgi:hypothetical protein